MKRLEPLAPPYPPEVAEDLTKIPPIALFRALAHNPRVLRRVRKGGLLDPGAISLRERELVILRTTALCGAAYEWGVHAAFFARAAGLAAAELAATVSGDASVLPPAEQPLFELCEALHRAATLTDDEWARCAAGRSPAQLIELIALVGQYHSISFFTNALALPLEPGAPGFPAADPPAVERHAGSCLCGRIRYEIDGDLGEFGYCHCRSCRKASGSAHAANAPVDRSRFRMLDDGATLREFESSPGKLRAFCTGCGSPIYAYLATSPDVLRIRLGSLDTPFHRRPRAHTFVADKATWEPIDDGLPRFATWAARAVLDQRGARQPRE